MENKNAIAFSRIQTRVGNVFYNTDKKTIKGVSLLAYIDARTAEEQLDDLYGGGNWAFKWERIEDDKWAIKGIMTVKVEKDGGWIVREDVGYPQEGKKRSDANATEWLKDAVSDALKRCAVQFGVGRFLYDAPFLYLANNAEEKDKKKKTMLTYTGNDGKDKVLRITDAGKEKVSTDLKKWYDSLEKDSMK